MLKQKESYSHEYGGALTAQDYFPPDFFLWEKNKTVIFSFPLPPP